MFNPLEFDTADLRIECTRFTFSQVQPERLLTRYVTGKQEKIKVSLSHRPEPRDFIFLIESGAGRRFYRADIWQPGNERGGYPFETEGVCTCPANQKRQFCKHLALAYITAQRILKAEGAPILEIEGINYSEPWSTAA